MSPLTSATIAVMVGVAVTGRSKTLADTADSLGGYTPERRPSRRTSGPGPSGCWRSSSLSWFAWLRSLRSVEGVVALVMARSGSQHRDRDGVQPCCLVDRPRPELHRTPAQAGGVGDRRRDRLQHRRWSGRGRRLRPRAPRRPVIVGLARRAYGSTTGDVLGAIEQVEEMAVLSAAAVSSPSTGGSGVILRSSATGRRTGRRSAACRTHRCRPQRRRSASGCRAVGHRHRLRVGLVF